MGIPGEGDQDVHVAVVIETATQYGAEERHLGHLPFLTELGDRVDGYLDLEFVHFPTP
jgi:hypothetical protein